MTYDLFVLVGVVNAPCFSIGLMIVKDYSYSTGKCDDLTTVIIRRNSHYLILKYDPE
jgi:hypothetical protein